MDTIWRFTLLILLCGYTRARHINDQCNEKTCQNGVCKVDDENKVICECDSFFSGEFCEIRLCNVFCEEDEICGLENDVSICKKKKDGGAVCDSNPCENRGFCLADDDNGFTCLCDGDYSGKTCNERICNPLCEEDEICVFEKNENICKKKEDDIGGGPCDPNPCLHNGTCDVTDLGEYFCTCVPPYRGDTCEEGSCSVNPCQNFGVCEIEGASFKCVCPEPFNGNLCEIGPCDPNPCLHNATCEVTSLGGYFCSCVPPYRGDICEEGICNPPCEEGEICVLENDDGICKKKEDDTGGDPCNPNPCHNGTCILDGKETSCICNELSFGQFCEKSPCDSNPCKNGGECTNLDREIFSCKCPPNYSGQTCEQRSILIEIKAEIKISENSFGDFFQRLLTSRSK